MGVSTKITQIRADGGYAMTGNQCKGGRINLQEIFGANKDGLKELLREVLQEVHSESEGDHRNCGSAWQHDKAPLRAAPIGWPDSERRCRPPASYAHAPSHGPPPPAPLPALCVPLFQAPRVNPETGTPSPLYTYAYPDLMPFLRRIPFLPSRGDPGKRHPPGLWDPSPKMLNRFLVGG